MISAPPSIERRGWMPRPNPTGVTYDAPRNWVPEDMPPVGIGQGPLERLSSIGRISEGWGPPKITSGPIKILEEPQLAGRSFGGQEVPTYAPIGGGPVSDWVFPVEGYAGKVDLHWGKDSGAADLFAPRGTPVWAAVGGKVVTAGFDETGGHSVLVRSPDGIETYYAHLDGPPKVQAGQEITPGTLLGGVGDTGNAKGTGPHLHFGAGYGIQTGTGPSGGAGKNFDVTARLRQILMGPQARAEAVPAAQGFDEEANRVLQAIISVEGGPYSGKAAGGEPSYGALKFHERGQLPAFAAAMGLSSQQAAELLQRQPMAGVEWALSSYLGTKIHEGQAMGLRGADLATYVQRTGQRSVDPGKAGRVYRSLFGSGQDRSWTPVGRGGAPDPFMEIDPVPRPTPGTPMPIRNPDGSISTELTITIEDDRLNGGRPTNIPTIWNGNIVSDDEAVENALRFGHLSGHLFPSFDTVDEAVAAAEQRSRDLGTGWEPEPSRPEFPAEMAPTQSSPSSVGSGQDENEDWRNRGWDPLRRMRELGQGLVRNPITGAIDIAFSPFELGSTAFKYAGGVAVGAQKAAEEALAGRPRTEAERTRDYGFFGGTRTEPPVGNIFDPAEARQRYETAVNPLVSFPAEMVAGSKGFGLIGKAGMTALRAPEIALPGTSGALARGVREGTERGTYPFTQLDISEKAAGLEAIGKALISRPVQYGLPAVGAVAGVTSAPEDADPLNRVLRGLEYAGGATIIGQGLRWGAARSLMAPAARQRAINPAEWLTDPRSKAISGEQAELMAQRLEGRPVRYWQAPGGEMMEMVYGKPGGPAQIVVDAAAKRVFNRIATFETDQAQAQALFLRTVGTPLPENLRVYDKMTLANAVAPAWGREIQNHWRAILKNAGAGSEEGKQGISEMLFRTMATERAGILSTSGRRKGLGKATGPQYLADSKSAIQNEKDALEELGSFKTDVDNHYGEGTSERWIDAVKAMHERRVEVLRYDEEMGFLEKGSTDKFIAAHGNVWGALRNVGTTMDPFTVGPKGESFLPNSVSVDYWYSNAKPTTALLEDTLSNTLELISNGSRNGIINSIRDLAMSDLPAWAYLYRPLEKKLGATPQGWQQVQGFENGKPFYGLMQQDRWEILQGMNAPQLDAVMSIQAKIGNLFRTAVTTAAIPFLLRNPPRDTQSIIQNYGLGGGAWRNIIAGPLEYLTREYGGLDAFVRKYEGHPAIQALPDTLWGAGAKVLGVSPERMWPEAVRTGGVTGVSTGMRGIKSSQQALAFPEPTVFSTAGTVLKTPFDIMRANAELGENGLRLGVYRAERARGGTPQAAGQVMHTSTVDFHKGGTATRVVSSFLPFTNPRVVGELTSVQAAAKDPEGYAWRLTSSIALPTMMAYAYNRLLWGPLYDKIPVEDRDRSWHIVVGSYRDERGEEKPLSFRVAKNDIAGLVATPIEHFMDAMFHATKQEPARPSTGQPGDVSLGGPQPWVPGQPLQPQQRTERTAANMWLSRLLSLLPINMSDNSDLINQGPMAALTANPLLGTIVQVGMNRDLWRDQPIIPEDRLRLPPEYQYGPQDHEAPKLLAQALKSAGFPESVRLALAPAKVGYAVRSFGGSSAEPFLGSFDLIWDKLKEQGVVPETAFRPGSVADLQLPPNTPISVENSYMSQLESQDLRPWWAKQFATLVGTSGAEATVRGRMSRLSQQEQARIEDTNKLFAAMEKIRTESDQKEAEVYRSNLTQEQQLNRVLDIAKGNRQSTDALRQVYPLAIVNPQERKAFYDSLPGTPLGILDSASANLPAGADIAQLAARFQNPPGKDMAALTPQDRERVRRDELTRMSNETGVIQSVLRDYINAYALERAIPFVPIPAIYLEEVANGYRFPVDPTTGEMLNPSTTPSKTMKFARDAYIAQKASEYNMPAQVLMDRVKSHMAMPGDMDANAMSFERAMDVSLKRSELPDYANPVGRPVGMPQDWAGWDAELERWKGTPPNLRPSYIQQLADAKAYGQVARIQFLMNSSPEDMLAYVRWFGKGRTMTTDGWNKMVSGEDPRYKAGDVVQWNKWDALIALHDALPALSPQRWQLRPIVDQLRRLTLPNWRYPIMLDEANRQAIELGQFYKQIEEAQGAGQ